MPPGIVRICTISSKHQFAAVTGGNICVRSIGHISRHGDKAELTIFGFVKPGKTRRGWRGFCPGPDGSDPGKTGSSSPQREGKKRSRPEGRPLFSNATDYPGSRPPKGRHQPHEDIIARSFDSVKPQFLIAKLVATECTPSGGLAYLAGLSQVRAGNRPPTLD